MIGEERVEQGEVLRGGDKRGHIRQKKVRGGVCGGMRVECWLVNAEVVTGAERDKRRVNKTVTVVEISEDKKR